MLGGRLSQASLHCILALLAFVALYLMGGHDDLRQGALELHDFALVEEHEGQGALHELVALFQLLGLLGKLHADKLVGSHHVALGGVSVVYDHLGLEVEYGAAGGGLEREQLALREGDLALARLVAFLYAQRFIAFAVEQFFLLLYGIFDTAQTCHVAVAHEYGEVCKFIFSAVEHCLKGV